MAQTFRMVQNCSAQTAGCIRSQANDVGLLTAFVLRSYQLWRLCRFARQAMSSTQKNGTGRSCDRPASLYCLVVMGELLVGSLFSGALRVGWLDELVAYHKYSAPSVNPEYLAIPSTSMNGARLGPNTSPLAFGVRPDVLKLRGAKATLSTRR
jgi:hypothetical protein